MALAAAPAAAQQVKQDWSNQWYWVAHLGVFGYATATQETAWEPMVGAHWFITKKRIALYAAVEQAFFTDDAVTVVSGRVATFSEVRRFPVGVGAMPMRGVLEPYIGGGFMIAYVVNPSVDCTGCSATEQSAVNEELANQSTSGYAWGMAGGQMNIGNLSVFGHYMYDATIAACARKARVAAVLTLNARHLPEALVRDIRVIVPGARAG